MNPHRKRRPSLIAFAAIALLSAAAIARTLTWPDRETPIAWYVLLFSLFLIPYFALLWHPTLPDPLLHLYFLLQSVLIIGLLILNPRIDFITALYPLLAYQAALVLSGRARWLWAVAIFVQTPLSLMILLDPLQGLALGLSAMAFAIVLPAIVAANEELENAGAQSRTLLAELMERHSQLEAQFAQIEELAGLEERSRLARELHDSVSQTLFGIILNIRSAQIILSHDPARLKPQLAQLQAQTQSALVEMRSLIAKLRPPSEEKPLVSDPRP
ncbi:MAG: sensor histidine kinase [Rudaea sp.]